jgi:ribonuclease HII
MLKNKDTTHFDQPDRLKLERALWESGCQRVMGLDEVGRGCLAGPVVAAGVILDPNRTHPSLRDSKLMSEKERRSLAEWITENAAFVHISVQGPATIDQINILNASIRAMLDCAEQDQAKPDYLLVDGNRFAPSLIPHTCVVKGDNLSASIAAASIIAKTYRDERMQELHAEIPLYGWDKNVGYPTKYHFDALERHGYTKYHRQSFSLRTNLKYHPA